MIQPSAKGILYLDAGHISVYVQGMKNMWSVELLPTVARDLEIVNGEELDKFVAWFIATNKIPAATLDIILSEQLLFRKVFTKPAAERQEEEKSFLASVPFEHVASKVYGETGQRQEIIAVNADFIELIKDAFELHGFVCRDVIPSVFFDDLSMNRRTPDVASSTQLEKKIESLRAAAIMTEHEELLTPPQNVSSGAGSSHRALATVIIVLAVLFTVLMAVLYWQFARL